MAFTLLANTGAGGTSTGVTTSGIDTTGADLLVAVVSQVGTTGTFSDSKGNTWTPLTQYSNAGGAACQLYWCVPSSVGSGHTFSYSMAGSYPSVAVTAWSGAAASPYDQETGSSAGSGSSLATGSITPSENNCLVITGFQVDGVSYSSIDGGFTTSDTVAFSFANHEAGGMAYLIQTSAASANPTWTFTGSSSYLATGIAVFKAAAGGGGIVPSPYFPLLLGGLGGQVPC